jgi:hypothetical protein
MLLLLYVSSFALAAAACPPVAYDSLAVPAGLLCHLGHALLQCTQKKQKGGLLAIPLYAQQQLWPVLAGHLLLMLRHTAGAAADAALCLL